MPETPFPYTPLTDEEKEKFAKNISVSIKALEKLTEINFFTELEELRKDSERKISDKRLTTIFAESGVENAQKICRILRELPSDFVQLIDIDYGKKNIINFLFMTREPSPEAKTKHNKHSTGDEKVKRLEVIKDYLEKGLQCEVLSEIVDSRDSLHSILVKQKIIKEGAIRHTRETPVNAWAQDTLTQGLKIFLGIVLEKQRHKISWRDKVGEEYEVVVGKERVQFPKPPFPLDFEDGDAKEPPPPPLLVPKDWNLGEPSPQNAGGSSAGRRPAAESSSAEPPATQPRVEGASPFGGDSRGGGRGNSSS